MLLLAVFYNTLDVKGGFPALAMDAFGSDLIIDSPVRTVTQNSQSWSKDAVGYDFLANGQGGPAESSYGEIVFPTSQDDALLPDFSPLIVDQNQTSRDQIIYYAVEGGDTVSGIADQFGVSSATILWANNLSSASYIKAGQRLEILPTDGVKYEVKKGDTLGVLAKKFKVSGEDIVAYNHLPADGSLRPADVLIIPGGIMPSPPRPVPVPRTPMQQRTAQITTNKYFVFPTTGRISQGLHGNNAVDIANQCGTPIYAAADGYILDLKTTISRAKNGPSVYDGYGNHIKIQHGNGAVTLYGHLESILVAEGQEVKQGAVIAVMGGGFERINGRLVRMEGAGRSTGCHLHFEVRGGGRNAFAPRR